MMFYPTISRGELGKYLQSPCVLLVASSFAAEEVRKYGKVRGRLPQPNLPDFVTERAADCGGFASTFKYGKYPYTPEQYVEWLNWKQAPTGMSLEEAREKEQWVTVHPQWAATMDFCCEDEITGGKPGIVQERQQKTTDMAYHFWTTYRDVPWCWVPTIQGWTVEDYERHAREMKPLIDEMRAYYGADSFFRVGIGTLCRRASVEMIREVVRKVNCILDNVPLHLWGVKLGTFQDAIALPDCIVSVDSAAWNGMWGESRQEWKTSGLSQRQWCHVVALPRYIGKLQEALAMPKQAVMF